MAQDIQHEVIVRNIEIPVQVYDGTTFVSNLMIDDFELYENGKLQKIRALYLVDKNQIKRMDAETDFMPLTSRKFYFIFQMTDYKPKIKETLDYFFTDIYRPDDTLEIITPMKEYSLTSDALRSNSKKNVIEYISTVIRKDLEVGNSRYKALIQSLRRIASKLTVLESSGTAMDDRNVGIGLNDHLDQYKADLISVNHLRKVNEAQFLRYAKVLKQIDAQKYVFIFYEREYLPELRNQTFSHDSTKYQDQINIISSLQEISELISRGFDLNLDRLIQAYADSNILFNFIFMDNKLQTKSRIAMRDQSKDIIRILTQVAESTGGARSKSGDPYEAFKFAASAINSRYILYYSPKNYVPDGKFREIKLKIKQGNYVILHRKGYFAD